jgi:hypothetical protein
MRTRNPSVRRIGAFPTPNHSVAHLAADHTRHALRPPPANRLVLLVRQRRPATAASFVIDRRRTASVSASPQISYCTGPDCGADAKVPVRDNGSRQDQDDEDAIDDDSALGSNSCRCANMAHVYASHGDMCTLTAVSYRTAQGGRLIRERGPNRHPTQGRSISISHYCHQRPFSLSARRIPWSDRVTVRTAPQDGHAYGWPAGTLP